MALAMAFASSAMAEEIPVIGGPCDGCEFALVGMPKHMESSSRIVPQVEPRMAMVVDGVVRLADGSPASGIIVYACQTNASGIYSKAATRHGALRGWVRSDAEGRYRFLAIRPGAYPSGAIPEHIHMHVIEPGKGSCYIDDITFSDDRLPTDAHRTELHGERGGPGESRPQRDDEETWLIHHDIILGMNIPGYPR